MTVAHQVPPSMGFPRQEYWSGLPFPPPGDLPDTGIKPASPTLAGRSFTSEPSMGDLNESFRSQRCYRGKGRSNLKDEKDSTCHWWSEDGGSVSKAFGGLWNTGRDFRRHPVRKPGAQSDNRKEQTSANLLKEQADAISPSASRQEVFWASKQGPSQGHQTSVPQKLGDKKWEIICSSSDFKQRQALRMPLNIPAPSVEKGIYAKKI